MRRQNTRTWFEGSKAYLNYNNRFPGLLLIAYSLTGIDTGSMHKFSQMHHVCISVCVSVLVVNRHAFIFLDDIMGYRVKQILQDRSRLLPIYGNLTRL